MNAHMEFLPAEIDPTSLEERIIDGPLEGKELNIREDITKVHKLIYWYFLGLHKQVFILSHI